MHTISPTETTNGAETSNNSGALLVSLSSVTPTVPGIPPLAPGLPPTPGQPSVPFSRPLWSQLAGMTTGSVSSIAP